MKITREELVEKMKGEGFRLTRSVLSTWEKKQLVPRAKVTSGGRGKAPKATYEPWAVERIKTVLEMRREGKGLDEISRHFARTHIDKVLGILKKYGHRNSDIYKILEGWRDLTWEEILKYRGAYEGGEKFFFVSYNDVVVALLVTFTVPPNKLEQAVAILELYALREKMATLVLRKKLLTELIGKTEQKPGGMTEWLLTRDDLIKIYGQHIRRAKRLGGPLKKAAVRLYRGKIPDRIKKHF